MLSLKSNFAFSSLQSITVIAAAKKTSSIILWSSASLACLIICGVFLVQSVIFFVKYPVGTRTKIGKAPIEFPAVSVCNLNPYKVSSLQQNAPDLYQKIADYSKDLISQQEADGQKREIVDSSLTENGHRSQDNDVIEDETFIRRRRQAPLKTAGTPDNIGTLFYTTFPPNYGVGKYQIMLATTVATLFPVQITTKDNSFTTTQNIDNKNVYTVTIGTKPSVGIKLSAAYEFTAYSMNFYLGGASADGFLILPADVLGIDYIVLSIEDLSQTNVVDIVATQNNTSIKVVFPGGFIKTYSANETDVVAIENLADVTGMRITSNKPIAVITSNVCTNYPDGCYACDHMVEQLTPTNTWGERFALTPFKHSCLLKPVCCTNTTLCAKCYEFFKVVAYTDGTIVKRFGSLTNETFTLNALEWRSVLTEQNEFSYLISNRPLQVGQYMAGAVYQNASSDPSLLMVSPTDGFTNTYFIVSCNSDFYTHYLTIVIDSSKAAGLLLNNQSFLGSTLPKKIPTTKLSAYLYKLNCSAAAKSFRISHHDISVLFSVAAYGFGKDISYAYMAGVRLGNGSYFCNKTADTNPPDGIDNDCDGWVDEELRNFIDDDNDGLIDEDLAAHTPVINVTDAQMISCNLSAIPLEADPALINVTVDPRCFPYNLTYTDVKNVSFCSVTIRRVWSLVSGCGNYADNVTQLITVTLPLDNYTAPPTAYLNQSADLSNPSATGVPSVTAACASVGPPVSLNWTYNDISINNSFVNRTWTAKPACSNLTVQLQQNIYIAPILTTTTTTTTTTTILSTTVKTTLSSTVTTTKNETTEASTAMSNMATSSQLTSLDVTSASVSDKSTSYASQLTSVDVTSASLSNKATSYASPATPITTYPLTSLVLSTKSDTAASDKQSTAQTTGNLLTTSCNRFTTLLTSPAAITTTYTTIGSVNSTFSENATEPGVTTTARDASSAPTSAAILTTTGISTSNKQLTTQTVSSLLPLSSSLSNTKSGTFTTASTKNITSEFVGLTSLNATSPNTILAVSNASTLTSAATTVYSDVFTFLSTVIQPSSDIAAPSVSMFANSKAANVTNASVTTAISIETPKATTIKNVAAIANKMFMFKIQTSESTSTITSALKSTTATTTTTTTTIMSTTAKSTLSSTVATTKNETTKALLNSEFISTQTPEATNISTQFVNALDDTYSLTTDPVTDRSKADENSSTITNAIIVSSLGLVPTTWLTDASTTSTLSVPTKNAKTNLSTSNTKESTIPSALSQRAFALVSTIVDTAEVVEAANAVDAAAVGAAVDDAMVSSANAASVDAAGLADDAVADTAIVDSAIESNAAAASVAPVALLTTTNDFVETAQPVLEIFNTKSVTYLLSTTPKNRFRKTLSTLSPLPPIIRMTSLTPSPNVSTSSTKCLDSDNPDSTLAAIESMTSPDSASSTANPFSSWHEIGITATSPLISASDSKTNVLNSISKSTVRRKITPQTARFNSGSDITSYLLATTTLPSLSPTTTQTIPSHTPTIAATVFATSNILTDFFSLALQSSAIINFPVNGPSDANQINTQPSTTGKSANRKTVSTLRQNIQSLVPSLDKTVTSLPNELLPGTFAFLDDTLTESVILNLDRTLTESVISIDDDFTNAKLPAQRRTLPNQITTIAYQETVASVLENQLTADQVLTESGSTNTLLLPTLPPEMPKFDGTLLGTDQIAPSLSILNPSVARKWLITPPAAERTTQIDQTEAPTIREISHLLEEHTSQISDEYPNDQVQINPDFATIESIIFETSLPTDTPNPNLQYLTPVAFSQQLLSSEKVTASVAPDSSSLGSPFNNATMFSLSPVALLTSVNAPETKPAVRRHYTDTKTEVTLLVTDLLISTQVDQGLSETTKQHQQTSKLMASFSDGLYPSTANPTSDADSDKESSSHSSPAEASNSYPFLEVPLANSTNESENDTQVQNNMPSNVTKNSKKQKVARTKSTLHVQTNVTTLRKLKHNKSRKTTAQKTVFVDDDLAPLLESDRSSNPDPINGVSSQTSQGESTTAATSNTFANFVSLALPTNTIIDAPTKIPSDANQINDILLTTGKPANRKTINTSPQNIQPLAPPQNKEDMSSQNAPFTEAFLEDTSTLIESGSPINNYFTNAKLPARRRKLPKQATAIAHQQTTATSFENQLPADQLPTESVSTNALSPPTLLPEMSNLGSPIAPDSLSISNLPHLRKLLVPPAVKRAPQIDKIKTTINPKIRSLVATDMAQINVGHQSAFPTVASLVSEKEGDPTNQDNIDPQPQNNMPPTNNIKKYTAPETNSGVAQYIETDLPDLTQSEKDINGATQNVSEEAQQYLPFIDSQPASMTNSDSDSVNENKNLPTLSETELTNEPDSTTLLAPDLNKKNNVGQTQNYKPAVSIATIDDNVISQGALQIATSADNYPFMDNTNTLPKDTSFTKKPSDEIVPNEQIFATTAIAKPGDTPKESNKISLPPREYDPLVWSSQMQDALPYFIKAADPNKILESTLGYTSDEFIFWCRYSGNKCALEQDAKMFSDPSYGNCFTFNWQSNTHFSKRAGQRLGLRLIFNTPSSDYLPFTLASGFVLNFHEPDEQPMLDVSGVKGSPGAHYIYSISKLKAKKVGQPYGPCATNETTSVFNNYANKSYTVETCLASCYQNMVLNQCSCGDPRYALPIGAVYCNITQKPCVDAVTNQAESTVQCGCQPACRSTVFDFSQTKALWPGSYFLPPKCASFEGLELDTCKRGFTSNYSRVDIYYDTMSETNLEEFAEYSFLQLLSDIFANMGLWLGFCTISVFELIVFPAISLSSIFCRGTVDPQH